LSLDLHVYLVFAEPVAILDEELGDLEIFSNLRQDDLDEHFRPPS